MAYPNLQFVCVTWLEGDGWFSFVISLLRSSSLLRQDRQGLPWHFELSRRQSHREDKPFEAVSVSTVTSAYVLSDGDSVRISSHGRSIRYADPCQLQTTSISIYNLTAFHNALVNLYYDTLWQVKIIKHQSICNYISTKYVTRILKKPFFWSNSQNDLALIVRRYFSANMHFPNDFVTLNAIHFTTFVSSLSFEGENHWSKLFGKNSVEFVLSM